MGMRIMSTSSYDTKTIEKIVYKKVSNPDPSNFKIIKYLQEINYLIIEVQYPDCTNYEGRKILIYKNCTVNKLLKQKTIDPHFSENTDFHSPIARFEPTKKGWEMAKILINNIRGV